MAAASFFPRYRIALTWLLVVVLFSTLLVSLSYWVVALPPLDQALSLVGWILVGCGVSGRIWSNSYISGRKTAELVVDGPYSMCRNPLYFFSLMAGLGIAMITETFALPALFLTCYGLYYPRVIAAEEARLRGIYGAPFDAYCARVPRLWPSFRHYSEPATYLVSAKIFRRNLTEIVWFVILGGVIHFIAGLHSAGYLPTLVRIY